MATGEHCQNRVMFKQFMQLGGMQYCQVDACRIGGVNEVLAVVLMAKKMNSEYQVILLSNQVTRVIPF